MIQPYEAHQLLVPSAPHQRGVQPQQQLQQPPSHEISVVRKRDLKRRRIVIAIVSLFLLTTVALVAWSSRGQLRALFTRGGKELKAVPMTTRGIPEVFLTKEEERGALMDERAPLFDFFLLSLSWPGSICLTLRPCEGVTDQTPEVFTLHGLWPQNDPASIRSLHVPPVAITSSVARSRSPDSFSSSSAAPSFPASCGGARFNYNLFNSDLRADLRQYWTDFKPAEPQFWSHEWTKHGTCAVKGGVFRDQVEYFGKTIDLVKPLQIMDALASKGIVPSNSKQYTVDEIVDAVEAGMGVRPVLVCNEGRFITEMRFCVDKNLNFFSCPGKSTANCRPDAVILRPVVQ